MGLALFAVALAAFFAVFCVIGAVIYYWQTNNGVIRIEINDPDVQVVFDKKGTTFKGVGTHDLTLIPGEYGLLVKRGDLEFHTDKLILKRRETVTLKIEWFREGKLQLAQDGNVIQEKSRPNFATVFKNGLGMEFALVPKGKTWLGGGNGQPGARSVEFWQDFYLGAYPVTQGEWAKVMQIDAKAADNRLPIGNVSFETCQQFVKRVNELTNEPGWTYRVPTQAEWEYACRGGPMTNLSESAFNYYFDKGTNELAPQQANFQGTGLHRASKVGSYPPNRLGLYDMNGNVTQWCQDGFGAGPVIRGGSYVRSALECRASISFVANPTTRFADLGLRLARVPAATSPAGPPIDLIARADLPRDVIGGNWNKIGATLVRLAGAPTAPAGLKLFTPRQMPEEYEIAMVAERLSTGNFGPIKGGGLALGFLFGSKQATVNMDITGTPSAWALEMVDGKDAFQSPARAPGARLPLNQAKTVRVQIHKQGVRVFCNDEKVIDWIGEPTQLSPQPYWKVPAASLFVGAEVSFRIHKLTLTPMGSPPPPQRLVLDLATAYQVPSSGIEFDTNLSFQDAKDPLRPGVFTKVIQVKFRKGRAYVIDMESTAIDSLLRLEDDQCKPLAQDDDSGGGQNARLRWQSAADGTYRIIATIFDGLGNQVGPFKLRIREDPFALPDESSALYVLPFKSKSNAAFSANSWITDFSSDGKLFLAAGDANSAGNIPIWESETGRRVQELVPKNGVWFSNARFVPGRKLVVAAYSQDKDLYLWDAETGKIVRKFVGHSTNDPGFAVSPTGKHLLSWGNDMTVRLWNVETAKELAKLEGHTDKVKGAAFSPDGMSIVTWGLDATARLWDVATGKEPAGNHLKMLTYKQLDAGNKPPAGVAACFSQDGKRLLFYSPNSKFARTWDIAANKQIWFYSATNNIQSAEFLANGRLVVIRSEGAFRILDGTGKLLRKVNRTQFGPVGHEDHITASPDGRLALARHSDGSVRLLDLATWEELHRYVNCPAAQAFSFSPDGRLAVAGSFRKGVFAIRLPPAPLTTLN